MQDDCRPKEYAGHTSHETDVGEIQRDCPTVDTQAKLRRTGPTSSPKADQGDAGHPGDGYDHARQGFSQQ